MIRPVLIFLAFLVVFSQCKKDVGAANFGDFPADVGRIIKNECAISGCHDNASYAAAAGLNLSTWKDLFKGDNSGSPVIPFNSKFSSLCYFINTFSDLGIQNTPTMPLNKDPLSHDDVALIKKWIDAGAPDVNGNVMWGDNPNRKKLYAVNQSCDVVTVFDAETQLPIRYIEVGNQPGVIETPHQVRVSPDGQYWYVNFINANFLQKFRCSDDKLVAEIPLVSPGDTYFGDWNTFVITKDSKKAFCVSWKTTGRLVCLDLVNDKYVKSLVIVNNPHAIALSMDESLVYVGAQTGNYVNVADTQFTFINQVSMDANPPTTSPALDIHDMILDETQNNLVMTCQRTNEVRVYSLSSNTLIAAIPVGTAPQEIIYHKTKNQFYLTCMEDVSVPGTRGAVTRIDNGAWTTAQIPCGFMPHGICADEKKKLLYVLSRNILTSGPTPHHTSVCAGRNGFVNFIDVTTFTVQKKKYELSADPYFISLRP